MYPALGWCGHSFALGFGTASVRRASLLSIVLSLLHLACDSGQVYERLYSNAFNRGMNSVSDAELGGLIAEEGGAGAGAPGPSMDG